MNILTAAKLNHFTTDAIHTGSQSKFRPACHGRKITGYVVPQGHKNAATGKLTEVTCLSCSKLV